MRYFKPICLIAALLSLVAMTSCERPATIPQSEKIALTYQIIDGCWQLTHLQGEPISADTYLYIEFDRTEHRYTMLDNMGSMYGTQTTGTFAISEQDGTYTLSGTYDYGVGVWNNKYIVELPDENSMLWRSQGENYEVMEFVRIDKIPELNENNN